MKKTKKMLELEILHLKERLKDKEESVAGCQVVLNGLRDTITKQNGIIDNYRTNLNTALQDRDHYMGVVRAQQYAMILMQEHARTVQEEARNTFLKDKVSLAV